MNRNHFDLYPFEISFESFFVACLCELDMLGRRQIIVGRRDELWQKHCFNNINLESDFFKNIFDDSNRNLMKIAEKYCLYMLFINTSQISCKGPNGLKIGTRDL